MLEVETGKRLWFVGRIEIMMTGTGAEAVGTGRNGQIRFSKINKTRY